MNNPMDEHRTIAIIPSAGSGRRLGYRKKPYLELQGKSVLAHTLSVFQTSPLIDGIIVVVMPEDVDRCRKEVVEKYRLKKVLAVVEGGAERQDSVRLGLEKAEEYEPEFVVIHDGARPFVTQDIIERTLNPLTEGKVAALCGVVPKDTVKEVEDSRVKRTIPRETLRLIQTPQAFRFETLKDAHLKAVSSGLRATDDGALVELSGEEVCVVEGAYDNIKITTEEDLLVAELILQRRGT